MTGLEADPLDRALGNAIRVRRKQIAMSQSTLADGLGLTFQQVQKYEKGSNRVSFSALVKISRVLHCRVTDLVADLDLEEAGQDARGEINHILAEGGALDLIKCYGAIQSKALRQAILGLARSLSALE